MVHHVHSYQQEYSKILRANPPESAVQRFCLQNSTGFPSTALSQARAKNSLLLDLTVFSSSTSFNTSLSRSHNIALEFKPCGSNNLYSSDIIKSNNPCRALLANLYRSAQILTDIPGLFEN